MEQPTIPPSPQPFPQQPTPISNSSILTVEPDAPPPSTRPFSFPFKLILIIFTIVTLFAGVGFLGFSLADAYRAIPISYPLTHNLGLAIVLQTPIFPKTPEQLVDAMIKAHEKIKSGEFKLSLATASKSFAGLLGTQNFDLVVNGKSDWHDPDKINATMHFNVAGQFDAETLAFNQAIYFKINTLPQGLTGLLSGYTGIKLSEINNLLNEWVYVESKQLQSEARDILENSDSSNPQNPFTDPQYQKTFLSIYQQTILPNLKLNRTTQDGQSTHHLNLTLTGPTIDNLVKQISENDSSGKMKYWTDSQQIVVSDIIKELQLDLYLNPSTYLIHSLSVVAKIDNAKLLEKADQYNPESDSIINRETYTVVTSLNLSHLGEPVAITAPTQSTPLDEYVAKFTRLITSATPTPPNPMR